MDAARFTWRWSAGCARPTPAGRRACGASGASTATTRRTAIACSSCAGTSRCLTIIVDTPERIAQSFQIVDELTDEAGLVTSEMVPAMASLAEGSASAAGSAWRAHWF